MKNLEILKEKKLLIVDDEQDVLDMLSDLLDMCDIDEAADYESAEALLLKNEYDLVILDIMGVQGYDLLEIAAQKGFSVLMLTAKALTPSDFAKSMSGGAKAYIPKEEMYEIETYAAEMLNARQAGIERPGNWFTRLKTIFNKRFGDDWLTQVQKSVKNVDWMDFDA